MTVKTDDTSLHNQAIELIKLTQNAKDEFLSEELGNSQKRTILTELFDSVVYENSSLSVKYAPFVESIANKSAESKEILKEESIINRTTKNNITNGGRSVDNSQLELIRPAWQPLVEELRTLSFDIV